MQVSFVCTLPPSKYGFQNLRFACKHATYLVCTQHIQRSQTFNTSIFYRIRLKFGRQVSFVCTLIHSKIGFLNPLFACKHATHLVCIQHIQRAQTSMLAIFYQIRPKLVMPISFVCTLTPSKYGFSNPIFGCKHAIYLACTQHTQRAQTPNSAIFFYK